MAVRQLISDVIVENTPLTRCSMHRAPITEVPRFVSHIALIEKDHLVGILHYMRKKSRWRSMVRIRQKQRGILLDLKIMQRDCRAPMVAPR